jgi:HPr kinase/phosphorylase
MIKYFLLDDMLDKLNLEVVNMSSEHKSAKIYTSEVNRPGLQLAGFYQRFEPSRIQVIGNAEWQYLSDLTGRERRTKFLEFTKRKIPAIVFTQDNYVFSELKEVAVENDTTVLKTKDSTSKFMNGYYSFAQKKLAPKTSVHGVLVEVYGLGVLIQGKSGIGKSETALDLLTRGHKLVSDDVVEITRIGDVLEGESPELTRYFMEIRGVGIIDIERLYGVSSVKQSQDIQFVIELENWDTEKYYDRLGFDETFTNFLGIDVPTVKVPMKPGRNTAMIIEVATRNLLQKKLGYNAAKELNNRLLDTIRLRKSAENTEE